MAYTSSIKRVLLVDDEPLARGMYAACLRAADDIQVVGEAADGEDAVRLCAQLEPDIVVMDWMMPRMNGLDATRIIRDAHRRTRVIIVTSLGPYQNETRQALAAGADLYIPKGSAVRELRAAIRAVAADSAVQVVYPNA